MGDTMLNYQTFYAKCDRLSSIELEKISRALSIACSNFDVGFCTERSVMVRNILGRGAVATFSLCGFSHTEKYKRMRNRTIDKYNHLNELMIPHILIPADVSVYRNTVDWAYHTVYIYQHKHLDKNNKMHNIDYVVTAELKYPILLSDYRKILNMLNRDSLIDFNINHVKMISEKPEVINIEL